jgi:hypothetical protein
MALAAKRNCGGKITTEDTAEKKRARRLRGGVEAMARRKNALRRSRGREAVSIPGTGLTSAAPTALTN